MIIESLIKDGGAVTFDCAKATIRRGSRIEIDNMHYASPEIQNAIKMGLCAIVGEAPVLPAAAPAAAPERMIRFRNDFNTKLCFECIRDYADPGMIVRVPESKLEEAEIRNAIASGWLYNLDNPETNPRFHGGAPVRIDEFTSSDILGANSLWQQPEIAEIINTMPATNPQPLPDGVPASRPRPKTAAVSQIKAKRVSSAGEGDGDESDDAFYKESKIIDAKPRASSRRAVTRSDPMLIDEPERPEPTDEENPDADFDFSDIFSRKKK